MAKTIPQHPGPPRRAESWDPLIGNVGGENEQDPTGRDQTLEHMTRSIADILVGAELGLVYLPLFRGRCVMNMIDHHFNLLMSCVP
jgi:hypothetical protein